MYATTQGPVLVVEDDDVDAMLMQRAWQKRNSTVDLRRVADGREALEILRGDDDARPVRPSVILLDLNMPGMNGLEFLDALRRDDKLKNMVVMILSTSVREEDVQEAYAKHVAGYFVKEVDDGAFARVLDMLEAYLETARFPESA